MIKPVLGILAALGMLATAAVAAAPSPSPKPAGDPAAACADMMDAQGVSAEGRAEMDQFMRSGQAAKAMTGMMESARRMGGGDPMKGMVRMMEMMGSMGGMTGSGMMAPSAPHGHAPQQQPAQ